MQSQSNTSIDFPTFVKNKLRDGQLDAYAQSCGTTTSYIRCMLQYKRRSPSMDLVKRLAENSGGELEVQELIRFFYDIATA